jgi:hypothetical protein
MSLSSTSYEVLSDILVSMLSPYTDEIIGDFQCGFDATDQILIRFSALIRHWRRMDEQLDSTLPIHRLQKGL